MKHFLMIIAMLVFALGTGIETAAEDRYSQKELNQFRKEAEKAAKNKVKELKKEGWKCGSALSLEGSVSKYLLSTTDFGGNYETKEITIDNAKSLSLGRTRLLSQAQQEYVQENQSVIDGELGRIANDGTGDDAQISRFRQKLMGELKGDVRNSFTIYRRNLNGTYEMRGYFLIDRENTTRNLERLGERMKMNNDILDGIMNSPTAQDGE